MTTLKYLEDFFDMLNCAVEETIDNEWKVRIELLDYIEFQIPKGFKVNYVSVENSLKIKEVTVWLVKENNNE